MFRFWGFGFKVRVLGVWGVWVQAYMGFRGFGPDMELRLNRFGVLGFRGVECRAALARIVLLLSGLHAHSHVPAWRGSRPSRSHEG